MKKITLVLILAISIISFTTTTSHAQSSLQAGVVLMPQYTSLLNINDFAAGDDLDYSTTFSFAGGLSGAYNFNGHIGIELNLLISSQGQKYTGKLGDYNGKGDSASYVRLISDQANLAGISPTDPSVNPYTDQISLTYFKIPVMFKLTGNTEKRTYFYMTVGPEFDFLLSASESLNGSTVNYTSTNPSGAFSITTKQLFASSGVDAVLNLGIGINLTSNLVLTGQVDFDYGLTDAEDKSFTVPVTSPLGTTDYHPYASNRSSNNNATVGLKLGLAYKFGGSSK